MTRFIPAQCPGPAKAPLPAIPPGRGYLLRCGVLRHIREHYPSFIAHTGSCARPKPARRLRLSLIRQVFAGCHSRPGGTGSWPFPTLSLQSLRRCLDPLPRGAPLVHLLASSQRAPASPQTSQVRHAKLSR